jgi:hypothetical protein
MYKKTHSPEIRDKIKINMREGFQKALQKRVGQVFPFYNISACRFFDRLNKDLNLEGKHAENGGEFLVEGLGYWVDYYEPNLNVVIEWNEDYHEQQKDKDSFRKKLIIKKLKCKFIEVKHTDNYEKFKEKIMKRLKFKK